ncbi:MAG: SGNH/GDSL hydrolase family protein [Pseudomonadota bacterium]|nr:SGNH/GDSL hydrolase family protein [Pseudomonadota bacterium]
MPEQQPSMSRKGAIVAVFSVVFMLFFAEVSLRLINSLGLYEGLFSVLGKAKPPLDTMKPPGMFYAHPYSAYAIKPGYKRGDFERINPDGFRGNDLTNDSSDELYRIVAIGGSTTFGVYVPWDQSYPYHLELELRNRINSKNIEVVNAGMTGSTSAESLHRLFTQILSLKPDMVIIYHAYNDLFPRVFNNFQKDYYHWRKSDPNNPPGMTRFYLWRLLIRAINPSAFHENYDLQNYVLKLENLPESDTDRLKNFDQSSSDAFAFNMENIILTLKANNIQPVLSTFAIHPDIWHWNDTFPAYVWEEGIRQNNEVIQLLGVKHSLPVVPFEEAMRGIKFRKYYSDSIHMTPEGNVRKAKLFADVVERFLN